MTEFEARVLDKLEDINKSLSGLKQKVEDHVEADTLLHTRHELALSENGKDILELQRFQSRAKGFTKGTAWVIGGISAVTAVVARAKGWF